MRARYLYGTYSEAMRVLPTRIQVAGLVILLAALALFPFYGGGYLSYMLTITYFTLIGACGLHILTGMAGQISIGHTALLAIGAYSSGVFMDQGMTFSLAVALGGLMAGLVGLVVAFPSLRLKGLYLLVTTLALHFLTLHLISVLKPLTGGSVGRYVKIPLGSTEYYYVSLLVAMAAFWLVLNLHRSKFGRALEAIRDRDLAAEMMGINVPLAKIQAFFLSSFFAGVAGALGGHLAGFIAPEHYTLFVGIQYLAILIVGGIGSLPGIIFGTVFIVWLPEILRLVVGALSNTYPVLSGRFGEVQSVAYGLVIVLSMTIQPLGLAGVWNDVKNYFRTWPFSY